MKRPASRVPRPAIALAILLLTPEVVQACSVCFGDPNSPMTKGANNAILLMLGIVGFVQVGFVALFFTFWRRARALRKRREQFRVIDGLAPQGR